MAFTAGSVELAKATKLAAVLAGINQTGVSLAGYTGAVFVERQAKKLGFGITGMTTGAGFPAFGTSGLTANARAVVHGRLKAELQNPTGLTKDAAGNTYGLFGAGTTVGIYLTKFVRDGIVDGATAQAGTTFEGYARGSAVHAGFTACVFFGGAAGSTGTVS